MITRRQVSWATSLNCCSFELGGSHEFSISAVGSSTSSMGWVGIAAITIRGFSPPHRGATPPTALTAEFGIRLVQWLFHRQRLTVLRSGQLMLSRESWSSGNVAMRSQQRAMYSFGCIVGWNRPAPIVKSEKMTTWKGCWRYRSHAWSHEGGSETPSSPSRQR